MARQLVPKVTRADRILSAAEIADVDAIHPDMASYRKTQNLQAVASCNINFIGPKPETIGKMGDKAMARETVSKVYQLSWK